MRYINLHFTYLLTYWIKSYSLQICCRMTGGEYSTVLM